MFFFFLWKDTEKESRNPAQPWLVELDNSNDLVFMCKIWGFGPNDGLGLSERTAVSQISAAAPRDPGVRELESHCFCQTVLCTNLWQGAA